MYSRLSEQTIILLIHLLCLIAGPVNAAPHSTMAASLGNTMQLSRGYSLPMMLCFTVAMAFS